jgi:hypothetical protein
VASAPPFFSLFPAVRFPVTNPVVRAKSRSRGPRKAKPPSPFCNNQRLASGPAVAPGVAARDGFPDKPRPFHER